MILADVAPEGPATWTIAVAAVIGILWALLDRLYRGKKEKAIGGKNPAALADTATVSAILTACAEQARLCHEVQERREKEFIAALARQSQYHADEARKEREQHAEIQERFADNMAKLAEEVATNTRANKENTQAIKELRKHVPA